MLADHGSAHDVAEVPDFGACANLSAFVDVGGGVDEVGWVFHRFNGLRGLSESQITQIKRIMRIKNTCSNVDP